MSRLVPASREVNLARIKGILDVSAVVSEEGANTLINKLIGESDEFVADLAATLQAKIDDAIIEGLYCSDPQLTSCCSARTVEELIESDLGLTR